MLLDCSSHNDYSQELPRFNQKRLEKCSTEKAQSYQLKPVAVEIVDPNRTRPKLIKKVGGQIDDLNRFKHILSFSTKIGIYRAFIMPHFTYCSSVWHSFLKEDSDRLERLHERALRYMFNDFCKGNDSLCSKIGYSLSCRRRPEMLLIFFKALKNRMPQYIQSSFNFRENIKNLQGKNKLVLLVAKTTTCGLKSTCYIAAKAWNALPNNLRSVAEFARFRNELRKLRNFFSVY